MQFIYVGKQADLFWFDWCKGWNSNHFSRDRLSANKSNVTGWLFLSWLIWLFSSLAVLNCQGVRSNWSPGSSKEKGGLGDIPHHILWFCRNCAVFFFKIMSIIGLITRKKTHILTERLVQTLKKQILERQWHVYNNGFRFKSFLGRLGVQNRVIFNWSEPEIFWETNLDFWTLGWCIPSILEIS